MRALLFAVVCCASVASCNKKAAEPEEAKSQPKVGAAHDAIRRGAIKGTLAKSLCDVSMKDMQAGIKGAGWIAAGYTEATSGGTTTRTFPVTHGRMTGAVSWYHTNDKDHLQATVVQGWPSAEDGECIVSVRTSDDGKRDEARRLLAGLVGD